MYEIYEQVVLTCTIINIFVIVALATNWIMTKVQDRREKKRRNQEKQ
jgi:heme/copper-type cytochrome/quinol oxidase subunit 2